MLLLCDINEYKYSEKWKYFSSKNLGLVRLKQIDHLSGIGNF